MTKKTTLRPSPNALLNPRCDPMFKAIFTQGTKDSQLALTDFISAVLGREIRSVTLQPNEPFVETSEQMQMSFDVSVVFADGECAELEMQGRNRDYDYGTRSEVHAARLLNNAVRKGSDWNGPKVYQISVLNFEYEKGDKPPLMWYTMRSEDGGTLGGRLNVIFLDLVKIRRMRGKPVEELSPVEKWGLFFAYEDSESHREYLERVMEGEDGLMAADVIVKTMSEEDANWFRQNSYFIARMDRNTELHNAQKRGYDAGMAQGLSQGMAQATRELALNMLRGGKLSASDIAKYTGLSQEDVESLANGEKVEGNA